MDALSLLLDQFRHMGWADVLVLSTISDNPVAAADASILAKLRHLHVVQKIFLDVWLARPLDPRVADDLDLRALCAFARGVHQESMRFLEALTPAELERVVELPWSKTATAKLGFEVAAHTLAETLVQVPQHSAYHRGQVATRLRELGVDPPMTDFIAWVWRHKPEAAWPGVDRE
ncbi:damage-inducible protein DinB [Chlorobaculum thiosulfatiphilum]|uniref:Damage-inducible protein DinB n=1 Tax=Chlorobaculum thiosulfatiphilum TaxID=115852 RepID=A0A5C4S5R4_CHLTI|nr:DinB family protein [Chlorobaculum thiosulfatiphilum]TNJ38850.1 damage-inducible protein DinB [Chlorobaculum thiosulfatiphilum]